MRRRTALAGIAIVAGLSIATVGGALFQPWKLWTHSRIDEAFPEPIRTSMPSSPVNAPSASSTTPTSPAAAPRTLASGPFRSGEHRTVGTATVFGLSDSSRVLRLTDFDTSDGPDVHVILSDQPAGSSDHAIDNGHYVKLGKLKATTGNQNYAVPLGIDLKRFRSVVIWCDRFNATLGSAPLS